jgi:predicted small metal-binding protein
MKKIQCKNMGMACEFVATGETAEEVKMKMDQHAMEVHGDMMKDMSPEDKEMMKKKMDEVMEETE